MCNKVSMTKLINLDIISSEIQFSVISDKNKVKIEYLHLGPTNNITLIFNPKLRGAGDQIWQGYYTGGLVGDLKSYLNG